MTATPSPIQSPSLTFAQATAVLDNPATRRAYLADAITVGLHMVNETQQRGYPQMLRPLFTSMADGEICFGLFEGERRVALLRYSYQPDSRAEPLLEETDGRRRSLGTSELTGQLQPVFDHVLARMEQQVWNRVRFD